MSRRATVLGPLSLMFVALFLRAQLSASISLTFLNSARCVATVPPFGSPIGPFVLVHMGDCFRHRARVIVQNWRNGKRL